MQDLTPSVHLRLYVGSFITGEELMFTMDVPYVPAQETPIVLAQADTSGASPQPDYLLTACKQTESTGDPSSALRTVDPAYMLKNYIQNRDNHFVDLIAIKNIVLIKDTTHGKITSVIDNTGRPWYGYDAEPDYVGNDQAIFMAEFEGKRYKIIVNIVVSLHVGESPLAEGEEPVCPPPKLIKVTKPTSGASGFGSDYYNLAFVSVTFGDIPGAAVGQTTGTTITLDTNAAGHNWYIDTTPWDNSEYLPTSNPNEWVAKAGRESHGVRSCINTLTRYSAVPPYGAPSQNRIIRRHLPRDIAGRWA